MPAAGSRPRACNGQEPRRRGGSPDLLRVPSGPVDLSALDMATPGSTAARRPARRRWTASAPGCPDLQEQLHAEGVSGGSRRLLLVLRGMDTSGKGGVIRHVVGQVDPQGCAITSFRRRPRGGGPACTGGSAGGCPGRAMPACSTAPTTRDVLVVRVHDLVPRSTWSRRYAAINRFEARLTADDTRVVKVFLHISKEEQRQRLLARLDDPTKNWKFNPRDVDERAHWAAYQEAYAAALERCNSDAAPWYRVPADRKWYRDWAIASLLAEQLEDMKLAWPKADFDVEEQQARLLADA